MVRHRPPRAAPRHPSAERPLPRRHPAPSTAPEPGPVGRWLYEPDGAVIRAHLVADVAARVGGRLIDPTIAYITTDELRPTPFATAYEITDVLPFNLEAAQGAAAGAGGRHRDHQEARFGGRAGAACARASGSRARNACTIVLTRSKGSPRCFWGTRPNTATARRDRSRPNGRCGISLQTRFHFMRPFGTGELGSTRRRDSVFGPDERACEYDGIRHRERRQRTFTVRAGEASGDRIRLSVYDMLIGPVYTPRAFFYRETLDGEALRASLSQTCAPSRSFPAA
ncbi:hypothetical protein SANTM175S_10458 [Streptomyces antimycoticus]